MPSCGCQAKAPWTSRPGWCRDSVRLLPEKRASPPSGIQPEKRSIAGCTSVFPRLAATPATIWSSSPVMAGVPWSRDCLRRSMPRARGTHCPASSPAVRVLNGKLDLLQAEAVGDLVDATVPAQAQAALRQLDGGLSRRITGLRDALIDLQAQLAYDVDFPEEDDGPISRDQLAERLGTSPLEPHNYSPARPPAPGFGKGPSWSSQGRPMPASLPCSTPLLGADRALVTEIPARPATRSRRRPIFTAGRSG